jgi:hypothetical protein
MTPEEREYAVVKQRHGLYLTDSEQAALDPTFRNRAISQAIAQHNEMAWPAAQQLLTAKQQGTLTPFQSQAAALQAARADEVFTKRIYDLTGDHAASRSLLQHAQQQITSRANEYQEQAQPLQSRGAYGMTASAQAGAGPSAELGAGSAQTGSQSQRQAPGPLG